MKLIVGLGNPGNEYDKTRHNIGFMFFDSILNDKFSLNKKFNAMELTTNINGEKVLFVKPLSYMNLSGEVVNKYVNYFDIALDDILVIQDDLDMNVGKYKFLFNHGDGGHNGIKNIILNLGSKSFLRLKVGISKSTGDTKNYVLGKFSNEEIKIINNSFDLLKDVVYDFVVLSRDSLVNKYNSQ